MKEAYDLLCFPCCPASLGKMSAGNGWHGMVHVARHGWFRYQEFKVKAWEKQAREHEAERKRVAEKEARRKLKEAAP